MAQDTKPEQGVVEPASPNPDLPFVVLVDDNFHYQDEDERWQLGAFATLEGAIAVCKELVDSCLAEYYEGGMDAAELYSQYTMFGDDPFIRGPGPGGKFSAWTYAKARAQKICGFDSTPSVDAAE